MISNLMIKKIPLLSNMKILRTLHEVAMKIASYLWEKTKQER